MPAECWPSAGACDVAESCDGVSDDCPGDSGLPDSDEDGACDAIDTCTNVAHERDFVLDPKSKLVIGRINTDVVAGNDRATLAASFLLPDGTTFADLSPRLFGARVRIVNAAGDARLDASLPSGAYGGRGTRGWQIDRRGTTWKYRDTTSVPVAGIVQIKIADKSRSVIGLVNVRMSAAKGSYPVVTGDAPLALTVVLGDQQSAIAGQCGESAFSIADCGFNTKGDVVTCERGE